MSELTIAIKNCCPDSAPRYIALEFDGGDVDWMVKCYRCGASTKLMSSQEDAVAAWNGCEVEVAR